MSKIVLITFTPKEWGGGVNRWVRDFLQGFPEAVHYSWWDAAGIAGNSFPDIPEWEKARVLALHLQRQRKVSKDDIIIVDGFWGAGWEDFPNVVSVCHGIWSHLTADEAAAGKEPDFPVHHAVQVGYRKGHLSRGGRLVAVSRFIQRQMDLQWGFPSVVINNGIDTDTFSPLPLDGRITYPNDPLIIHGVNDRSNPVKGWDHIEAIKSSFWGYNVLSLDEAHERFKERRDPELSKHEVLALADLVVIPSSYEGNSYFALETMACGVPVVAYDIGLFYEIAHRDVPPEKVPVGDYSPGIILNRSDRSPKETVDGVRSFWDIQDNEYWRRLCQPRRIAERYSVQRFHREWGEYIEREFGHVPPSQG